MPKLFSLSFYVLFFSFEAFAESRPVDRLLLDVNGIHYTQRQMESYVLIRGLLSSGPTIVMGADRWAESLQVFEALVLMEQEAFRLGGYQPSEAMQKQAMLVVERKFSEQRSLSDSALSMGLVGRNIERVVSNILRIEGLRRSRISRGGTVNVPSLAEIDLGAYKEDQKLIQELKSRAVVRHYDGVSSFRPLASFPE